VRYEFESLAGEDRYGLRESWARQNRVDEVFMLYQSMNEFQKAHVNYITRVPNSAQPYY
jgi:hypothetical protein